MSERRIWNCTSAILRAQAVVDVAVVVVVVAIVVSFVYCVLCVVCPTRNARIYEQQQQTHSVEIRIHFQQQQQQSPPSHKHSLTIDDSARVHIESFRLRIPLHK